MKTDDKKFHTHHPDHRRRNARSPSGPVDPGRGVARRARLYSRSIVSRELILFTADLTQTAWYRGAEKPPAVPLPDGVELRWLSAEEWRSGSVSFDRPRHETAERFASGARCLIGWDKAAEALVSHHWVSTAGAYVDWIFDHVRPAPGHLLAFDSWVHPDHAGSDLFWAGASTLCAEAVRCRHPRIFAGFDLRDFVPNAVKGANLGLGVIVPYSSLIGMRFFDAVSHYHRAPSPKLVEFGRRLRDRYAGTLADIETENGRRI